MNSQDYEAIFLRAIREANYSLDLLAVTGQSFITSFPVEEIVALTDERLKLRCIMTEPYYWSTTHPKEPPFRSILIDTFEINHEILLNDGWEIKTVSYRPPYSCFIIDNKKVFLISNDSNVKSKRNLFYINDFFSVQNIVLFFKRLWDEQSNLKLIYEDILFSSIGKVSQTLLIESLNAEL